MTVSENFTAVTAAIAKACKAAGRKASDITLVAVSKEQPPERIDAALATGHRIYGENRVHDAEGRWAARKQADPAIRLHLIGPLQSNKVKDALALFDVIETVDRDSLVLELAKELKKAPSQKEFFIQVNTGDEAQKSGVSVPGLPALLELCKENSLPISGLMCIPPVGDPPALHFALLKKLAAKHSLQHLSMGMSGDYPEAIAVGATHIRVGTALFGERL